MGKSTVSVPISARPALTPPKGVTANTPTVVINTSTQPRLPRRWAFRHPDRIEIGGGVLPTLKCSRKDLCACVVAVGAISAVIYAAKYGFKKLFSPIEKSSGSDDSRIPEPPKIQTIVDCVNSAGKPKKALIPDMVQEGGISIFAGIE